MVRDQSPVNRVQLFRNVYRWYVYHSQSVMYEVCVRGSYLSKSINTAAAPHTRRASREPTVYLFTLYNYIALHRPEQDFDVIWPRLVWKRSVDMKIYCAR